MNVNTIGIYLGACKNGQIKTVIVRDNGTETIDCHEDKEIEDSENEIDDHETEDESDCCNVVSPRKCERHQDEWVCFNKRQHQCGSFCRARTVYLSPSRRGNKIKFNQT